MRTWTRLVLALLLILPFTPALLRAADPEMSDKKKIEDLQRDVKQLREDVESLRNDVRSSSARGARTAEDLQEIKALLRTLARQQETLRIQAGYDPRSVIPPGAPPSSGTITLHNVYSAPATVNINGRAWRVEPNQTLPITGVPTGTFQYSVDVEGFGLVEPPRTGTLRPAGYRINIFPRMSY